MRVSFTAYYYRTLQATASYLGELINFFFFLYTYKILGGEKTSGGKVISVSYSWGKNAEFVS